MSTRAAARQPSDGPAAPTEATLRASALRHLARYATTAAGLVRVLDRRVERWRRTAGDDAADEATHARAAVRRVVAALVSSKVLDDAAYAQMRARTLLRAGRSRQKVGEHLALRGLGRETIADAVPQDATRETAGALLLMRRRKLGVFASDVAGDSPPDGRRDAAARVRALGILARAGFGHEIAHTVLAMELDEAERRIDAFREWQLQGLAVGQPEKNGG